MPSVQPQIEELKASYLMGLVEKFNRATRRYSLEQLFPEETRNGTRWKVEILTAGRGRGQVKHLGAPTSLIQNDWFHDMDISPFHFGEKAEITDEEMSTMRIAGSQTKLDRARIAAAKVLKLMHRWRALRQYMCSQMLGNGTLVMNENRVIVSLNYQIATLTPPGASWAVAGTDIVGHMQGWIGEFQDTCHVPPKYVLFDPRVVKPYWLINTGLQNWLAKFERTTVEKFFASMMNPYGAFNDTLFNLTWIPITDGYETTDGDSTTFTSFWPTDVLTFVAEPEPGEEILKWLKARTVQAGESGGPTPDAYEVDEPKGQNYVRLHANGIPALLTADRIMRVADLTP